MAQEFEGQCWNLYFSSYTTRHNTFSLSFFIGYPTAYPTAAPAYNPSLYPTNSPSYAPGKEKMKTIMESGLGGRILVRTDSSADLRLYLIALASAYSGQIILKLHSGTRLISVRVEGWEKDFLYSPWNCTGPTIFIWKVWDMQSHHRAFLALSQC